MKKILLFLPVIFLILFLNVSDVLAHDEDLEFFHPVKIEKNKPLNITDCISLAYQNSPKIKRQKYNLDIAKSNLGIARSGYFPVISAGLGFYNENNSDSVYYDKHYRDLPSVGVSINKLIWDFGKTTANIKMEEFYKIGAEYEFMDSLCSTLFDIKWKYYNLLRAKALLDIADENVKICERIYKKSHKSPDRETSLVYLSTAKITYYEALDNFQNAKLDLDNAMYIPSSKDYLIEDTETFSFKIEDNYSSDGIDWKFMPHEFPFKREDSAKIAYHNSPDLHVLIATKKAMIEALKYVRRTYLPELNANVGYGYNNTNQTSNSSLQVGVSLDSSVNLMELKHSIKGADAQVNLAQNEIDLFKKDLYYEIQRAFNRVDKTTIQIPIAKEKVNQAFKTMKLVDSKYGEEGIDYTSLHDAREDYIKANEDYVESLYNYNTALIQVEMAMHCHIVDIHHKSGHAVHHHSEELISDLIKALECTQEAKSKQKSKLFGKEPTIDEDEDL